MANEIFTGASRYSSDFEAVINRAVGIASLPLTQLRAQKAQADAQTAAVQSLNEKVAGLQTALNVLDAAINTNPFTVSVANNSVLTASVSNKALAGTYTVNVLSPGSRTVAVSSAGLNKVTDPDSQNFSSDSSFFLTVDGVNRTITPAENSLTGIAAAINADAGSGVAATIINLGSSASPDYRLSLESQGLGPSVISLTGTFGEYLTEASSGEKASYQVNGTSTVIESDSRSITIAPGLTAEITAAGTATVSVNRNIDGVQNGLTNFVAAYNRFVDELDLHRGSGKGQLAGQSLISHLSNSLRKAAFFSSDSGSLSDLGIRLDKEGHASLDTAVFREVSLDASALSTFFGDSDSGGFLEFATEIVNSLNDPDTGTLSRTLTENQNAVTHQQTLIEENQNRVDQLRESLQAQFAAADALIANLEQRVLYVQGLFGAILKPNNS